jgi:hypothetical protein
LQTPKCKNNGVLTWALIIKHFHKRNNIVLYLPIKILLHKHVQFATFQQECSWDPYKSTNEACHRHTECECGKFWLSL